MCLVRHTFARLRINRTEWVDRFVQRLYIMCIGRERRETDMIDIREGHTNCDNAAIMQGYTRHVLLDSDGSCFAALIRPDVDLDGTFRAFDTDNQEWLNVNGWLFSITDAE